MNEPSLPLIVGAGPVGLSAALFLADQGLRVRLIDKAPARDSHSRALAVNPRTLELLEPTGVTERMLSVGMRIGTANFWRNGRIEQQINFDHIHPRYPWMLALSQASTEKYLEEAFTQRGGRLERGRAFVRSRPAKDVVKVDIENVETHAVETITCPWIFGADGAHSAVREDRHLRFVGDSFRDEWHLLDVPLSTHLPENAANAFLFDDGGFRFMIRVIDERPQSSTPLWRIFGNEESILDRLPEVRAAGPREWQTHFHIGHRIAERLNQGRVYLAGDAAHIHSPMGARGMNLGIEDAWVFSQLARLDRFDSYHALRHPVDQAVVNRVRFLSRLVVAKSGATRLLRRFALAFATGIPFFREKVLRTLTGLDHSLPIMPSPSK